MSLSRLRDSKLLSFLRNVCAPEFDCKSSSCSQHFLLIYVSSLIVILTGTGDLLKFLGLMLTLTLISVLAHFLHYISAKSFIASLSVTIPISNPWRNKHTLLSSFIKFIKSLVLVTTGAALSYCHVWTYFSFQKQNYSYNVLHLDLYRNRKIRQIWQEGQSRNIFFYLYRLVKQVSSASTKIGQKIWHTEYNRTHQMLRYYCLFNTWVCAHYALWQW